MLPPLEVTAVNISVFSSIGIVTLTVAPNAIGFTFLNYTVTLDNVLMVVLDAEDIATKELGIVAGNVECKVAVPWSNSWLRGP